jgi:hypothetical protein
MSIEHSRPLLLASKAAGADEETLKDRLEQATTVVRVDPELPGAQLTGRVLLTTLRRLPGRLTLDRDGLDDEAVAELVAAVADVDSTRPLTVVNNPPEDATACIHFGLTANEGWVRVVPDGYGAQLAADAGFDMSLGRPANALGSVFAAALGAAEAFKHVAGVVPGRCTAHRHIVFCPVTLTADTRLAPELPGGLLIDVALVGAGAIGTATALILSELSLVGRVIVCDPERFGPENRGTYTLGGEHEAATRPRKVDLTGDLLAKAGYDVSKVEGMSSEVIRRVDAGELPWPEVVLTGVDSIEARREAQGLWSDHVIDAATGDTAVGLCHATPEGPCLRCFFPERHDGPSALDCLASATGLPVERLRRGQDVLTDADVASLTHEQRALLAAHRGEPVCGLASALGLTTAADDGYRPSVPFVSQMAACLAVGRLLALRLGGQPDINWLQFDTLHGPHGDGERRNPTASCFCQTRSAIVGQLRTRRRT